MDEFVQDLLHYHGNGKHKYNWLRLRDHFARNCPIVEAAALQINHETGATMLLAYASHVSSTLRASLIVTLMLVYQMEFLSDDSHEFFMSEVLHFFDYITPQEAECASEELARLAHLVTRLACENKQPAKVIPSLSRLSSTVSPNPNCLTAIHADILQACISGRMYSFAHDFISGTTILEINPKLCYLDASDYLKYFYYSGIVYISVKNFKKALACFDEVLSFPADVLSSICVDAYKKALLVSLIRNGSSYNDNFPSVATPTVKKLSKCDESIDSSLFLEPYRKIEKMFLDNDLEMSALTDDFVAPILAIDLNTGLAKQAVEALHTHRILKISKAYMSLTIDKLTTLVNGDFTNERMTRKLLAMNQQGILISKINSSTGVVRFQDLTSNYEDSVDLLASMTVQLKNFGELSDKLRSLHNEVIISPRLLKNALTTAGKDNIGSVSAVDHDIFVDEDDYD